MYFIINTAFANYLEMFSNLTDSQKFLLIKNRTMYEQILPVNLSVSDFDKSLLHASTNLKDFIYSYANRKETTILNINKNFSSNNHIMDIFMFMKIYIIFFRNTLINRKGNLPQWDSNPTPLVCQMSILTARPQRIPYLSQITYPSDSCVVTEL